ncbi:uncharacterized protein H6S33_000098 [Morchella sextelata]|uniref:uncharacterized protein n=1 Tax=Morchella sextelata TaxID=1174677 RepID=UPI001D03BE0F|nr:uncharacterized protein H6S33_000098 [Morchella sextelata]KAH0614462.1 hypothetical protein H6S33_000098 [Morchella sextelata]
MSDEPTHDANGNGTTASHHSDYNIQPADPNPPTIASFAPISSSPASRSRFQVHQKSPLLASTPPQITRALSQSYPYIKAANYVLGLLTWTTPDPWESFLVVAAFWAAALYGDVVLRFAGNVFIVVVLILGMFLRRYHDEPTSTTLDEILETLNTLTTRMNIFFEPFLQLTRWLSTTKTATTATTRPALTTLFVRILLTTPLWLALSVYPTHIITARRIVLLVGTLILSWHSRPAKVSRTVLWRSQLIRKVCSRLTGLSLMPPPVLPTLPPRHVPSTELKHTPSTQKSHPSATSPATRIAAAPRGNPDNIHPEVSTPLTASTTGASPGVKFTFAIYENQRRWLGVGWTASLFAYERAPFTDEHLQPAPAPAEFVLPVTGRGSGVRWRWVEGEDWRVEGANGGRGGGGKKQEVKDKVGLSGESGEGWVYYDNKWRDGRRGVDGWGKYTRRRKWYRNAELVEDLEDAAAAELPAAEVKVKPEVVVTDEEGEVVER